MSRFIILKQKRKKQKQKKWNAFTVPCEKSKAVSLAYSIMKKIVDCFSRFPVKLICCIAFGSGSSACCLLKSIATIL